MQIVGLRLFLRFLPKVVKLDFSICGFTDSWITDFENNRVWSVLFWKQELLVSDFKLSKRLGDTISVSFSVIIDLFGFTGFFGGLKGALLGYFSICVKSFYWMNELEVLAEWIIWWFIFSDKIFIIAVFRAILFY